MRLIVAFTLFMMTSLALADSEQFICKTGPGLSGKLIQTRSSYTLRVFFRQQLDAGSVQLPLPGYCAAVTRDMMRNEPRVIHSTHNMTGESILPIIFNTNGTAVDYQQLQAMPGFGLNAHVMDLIKALQKENHFFYMRLERKGDKFVLKKFGA